MFFFVCVLNTNIIFFTFGLWLSALSSREEGKADSVAQKSQLQDNTAEYNMTNQTKEVAIQAQTNRYPWATVISAHTQEVWLQIKVLYQITYFILQLHCLNTYLVYQLRSTEEQRGLRCFCFQEYQGTVLFVKIKFFKDFF